MPPLCVLGLFIMPERLLRLITAAECRPPGGEVEPHNYRRSLIGMDSMETSQSQMRHFYLNYSSPCLAPRGLLMRIMLWEPDPDHQLDHADENPKPLLPTNCPVSHIRKNQEAESLPSLGKRFISFSQKSTPGETLFSTTPVLLCLCSPPLWLKGIAVFQFGVTSQSFLPSTHHQESLTTLPWGKVP